MIPFINTHTHKFITSNSIGIFNLSYDDIPDVKYCSFGMHPWDLGKYSENEYMIKLKQYCIEHIIIAVGEIGIDRAIEYPVEKQVEVFKQQQLLAEKYSLPTIIHSVRSWSDLISLRIELKSTIPWIFHGYSGNLVVAKQLISKGCYLSFGPQLMNNAKIQTVFKNISLDRIFLETDASNEKIENIYKKAAYLHHICIDKLKKQIESNFISVFGDISV